MKKYAAFFVALIVLIIGVGFTYRQLRRTEKGDTPTNNPAATQETPQSSTESFNKQQHSLTDPTSIWLVVDKQRGISADFVPDLVVPDVKLRLASSEEQMQINTITEPAIKELTKDLKAKCGSGGTYKLDNDKSIIEIQGDKRETIKKYFDIQNIKYKGM